MDQVALSKFLPKLMVLQQEKSMLGVTAHPVNCYIKYYHPIYWADGGKIHS
jgi:hypothetical protein